LSLAETQLGYQLVAQARDSIKVIIEPQRQRAAGPTIPSGV
jgi:hypothetical protein